MLIINYKNSATVFCGGFVVGETMEINKDYIWNYLKKSELPIILYGMGDGADKVLTAFEKYGIKASGVMASDDFVRGQSFHEFTVKKLSDIEKQYPDFIIALCFATQLPDVMQNIFEIAKKHKVIVPSVPAFGEVLFDEKFMSDNNDSIKSARNLLADDLSKKVFDNILEFYKTGELTLLDNITTDKDEAFSLLSIGESETYVDLGAYNGDTIDEFLHYTNGKYKHITALEPNAKNYSKLQLHCADMKNLELWQLGAYSHNTTLCFNNKAGRNSAIVSESSTKTPVAAVDTILCGRAATYVKADVEGADFETILGMKNTLKMFKPKLNFSAYHRFEDIFRLPLLISGINPEYKIYLRHHPYIPAWDTNLYCI